MAITLQTSENKEEIKTEGTSQTFGQLFTAIKEDSKNTDFLSLSRLKQTSAGASDPSRFLTQLTSKEKITESQLIESLVSDTETQKNIIKESIKIDYFLCLKSKESDSIDFNTLKTPDLECDYIYQFFIPSESNITIQEDPIKDPLHKLKLSKVSSYVDITWTPQVVTSQISDKELSLDDLEFKRKYLQIARGVATEENSNFIKSSKFARKNINPINKDGIQFELIDSHELEAAFNATSNERMFTNSVNAVLNTTQPDIDKLDFTDLLLDEI